MTGPRRLIEGGTDFERAVLASARLDVAGDARSKFKLVAVGVGAAMMTTTTPTAGAGLGAAGAAAGALGAVGAAAIAKWVSLGVVVVGIGTAMTAASLARRGPAPARAPRAETSAVCRVEATPPEAPPPAPPEPIVPALPDPAPPRPDVGKRPPAAFGRSAESSNPSRVEPSLGDEIAALDRVRAALAARDPERALRQLDGFDRAFPSSMLSEEATVLRVDALAEHGDRSAAEALARRFLVDNPASPHAAHLRQVLGSHNL